MNTNKPLISLIGATGLTGRMIVNAGNSEFDFRLIARNPDKLRTLASELGADGNWTSLDTIEEVAVARAVEGSTIVINVAGAFATSAPIVARAALSVRASYIDISNERAAVQAVLDLSRQAQDARVALAPASGYGTVATEGLAAWLANGEPIRTAEVALMPDSEGGTAAAQQTTFASIASGGARVTDGRYEQRAFGRGARRLRLPDGKSITLVPVDLGDLASIPVGYGADEVTASFGLGVPPLAARAVLPLLSLAMRSHFLRSRLSSTSPTEQTPEAREYVSRTWARVGLRDGQIREGWMTAGEGYRFTADAVLAVARRIAAGSALPGSMTAIRRFGPEFLESLPGVALTTVAGTPAHA